MGICQPRRSFHSKCVLKSRRTDQDFKCLVCRPADREDFCLCSNGALTDDIVMCRSNNVNGCTNFIHHCCDMGQNDTIGKIELKPSFVLSSDNTNYKNDIQLFPQLFDELRINGDYH